MSRGRFPVNRRSWGTVPRERLRLSEWRLLAEKRTRLQPTLWFPLVKTGKRRTAKSRGLADSILSLA